MMTKVENTARCPIKRARKVVAQVDMSQRHPAVMALHELVLRGGLQPGDKLPTFAVLEKQFKCSNLTIHRAVARLREEGFLDVVQGKGTFISSYPPHLCQYGLVFGTMPNSNEPRFYQLVRQMADELQASTPEVRFNSYFGIDGHSDVPDYERLVEDVVMHRLAGLIFIFVDPWTFASTPILDEPDIGRVAHVQDTKAENVAIIRGAWQSCLDKGLDYFASRGRRRVGVVITPQSREEKLRYLQTAVANRGMQIKPEWVLSPFTDFTSVRNSVLLLMRLPAQDRPDALFSIVEVYSDGVASGLLASGVSIGEDIDLVANCNSPIDGSCIIPMKRIVFDVREYVRLYTQLASDQKNGNASRLTLLEAKFEDDS